MEADFQNYFNYFTEVEEHFQRTRGTGLFLLSPLDWALIETWKDSGVPLEAVLRGIDEAFAKWRSRKSKTQMVNSLAFCAQAVLTEAQILAGAAPARKEPAAAPFSLEGAGRGRRGPRAARRRRRGALRRARRTGTASHRARREDDRRGAAGAVR
jgi:hypothetical protein